ncbi:MAG: hypothetical protein J5496_04210 [Lachnospiraceae bacterium]|nr:hypothetical protein [Lachnospiraceae bacterium]
MFQNNVTAKKGRKPLAWLLLSLLLLGLTGCSIPMKATSEEAGSAAGKTSEAAGEASQPEPTSGLQTAARQLEERWLSGDLSDLAGFYEPQAADPDEAARLKAIRDDFAVFEEDSGETKQEEGILSLLQPYTKLQLPEIPDGAAFPLTVQAVLVTPDLAALLQSLHYESYEDAAKLTEDLTAALRQGNYSERSSTLTLTLLKDGDTVYAEPNREALFAFYGGLAELYMTEYQKFLEEIGNALGGQEP